jgi:molybdopterin-containing oxidoreductase family molybdopterin binding subunit
MANVEQISRLDPGPFLEINPQDARPRNIENDDVVRVFNGRGQVKLKARLSEDIKPGVVAIEEGWWPEHYIEGHHNRLTHEKINEAQLSLLGPNAALCDVLVEVKKEP